MLSHEETQRLLRLAKEGDESAKSSLLDNNLPLVKNIVKRYLNGYVEYDDLFQLGCLGLYKAIINFDFSFNVRFSTYAVPMIAGEIKRYIRDDGPIKVSRSIKTLAISINNYIAECKCENKEDVSVEELAEKFGVDKEEIIFAMDSSKLPVSIYDKNDNENSNSIIDTLQTEDKTDEMIEKILLRDIINSLPSREKKIIILRYYRDMTQTEVAEILGISQVQVSRIESKTLKLIKTKMEE